jgi:hypothetical protein
VKEEAGVVRGLDGDEEQGVCSEEDKVGKRDTQDRLFAQAGILVGAPTTQFDKISKNKAGLAFQSEILGAFTSPAVDAPR